MTIDLKKLTLGQLVTLSGLTERDAIAGDGAFHYAVSLEIQSREAAGERVGKRRLATVRPIRPGNRDWLVVTVAGVPGLYAGARRLGSRAWGVYFREENHTLPVEQRGDPAPAFGQRAGQEELCNTRQEAIELAIASLVAGRIVS